MELFIFWASFIGSWFLVAGSIYQAALELKDQDIQRDRIQASTAHIKRLPPVSGWWWFIPPVKFILEKRRNDEYRKAHLDAMTKEDTEALIAFMNKSEGWTFVAGGGFLLALKETYELLGLYHNENIVLFIGIVIVLAVASVFNTVVRLKRGKDILSQKS